MADGELGTKPVFLPILRRQDNACPDGVPGVADDHGLPVQKDLTAVLGVYAEDGPGGLGPPGAHQPGKAHDLALVEGEVDVPHHPPGVEVPDLEDLFALLAGDPGELFLDLPAHHIGNDLIQGHVLEVHGGDVLAVTHDGDPVYDVLQLLQSVGDIHDPAALVL